ncbi:MAG TPA: tetratricopeptide repeat protein [Blastocatellia bacterium]|nr:tetratricopeptide repeat protein [Blastocatellia bacterium]
MAKSARKRTKLTVKEMKFKNDPMVRLYDRTQEWLQERSAPAVRIVAGIAGVVILSTALYYFFSYRESKADGAFAAALEKFNAQVTDTPPPNSTTKFYTDEQTKWRDAADAFDKVANDYPGSYGVMARYYEGTAYLHIDKARGQQILQEVVNKNRQPTSDLARLALGDSYASTGDNAKAIQFYQQIMKSDFVPKQVVELDLGHAYENSGDKKKAVDAYFDVAQADRESDTGTEAQKRLTALAPERLKDLPLPTTPTPGP